MALSTQPYKGTRDFYPEDMRVRSWMFNKLRQVCESFGYEEYDTPILEPLELYTAKTSEEIVNEQTYSFDDRGGRRVVMRPEMTPSVSRIVAAKRQELGYPARLYSIPNCFRYERPQRGRLREFWQLNADLFGVSGLTADMEIVQLADATMKTFGASDSMYEIRINSRVAMNSAFSQIGLNDEQKKQALQLIDRKDKMGNGDFEAKAVEIFGEQVAAGLNEMLNPQNVPQEIAELIDGLKNSGVNSVTYEPVVARGFDYYTDIVFEVFDTNPENNRSLFGGGRYDGLVGQFGVEPVPTVGFGMGDVTLLNFLQSNNLVPDLAPKTDVVAILIGDVYISAQPIVSQLREAGINVAVDSTDRKLDKKIKAAEKLGIQKVLFIGENELSKNTFALKNIVTGESTEVSSDGLVKALNPLCD